MKPASRVVVSLLTITNPISATKYGYIESKECVDPSGYEQCYKSRDDERNVCINKNCEGQNIDCLNACDCVFNVDVIDCALTHCWNKVYSCEYQNTVLELGGPCIDEKFKDIPFFPAPDDVPDACSCNLGKIATSLNRAVDELDTCIERNQEIWDSLSIDEQGNLLISQDEDYPQCGDYNDAYNCANDLKFTPPGKDNSAKFYAPGEFPKNGTKTMSNMDGSITSPLSGATFTWTNGNIVHPITVASVDAKPTDNSKNNENKTDDTEEIGKEDEEETGEEDEEGAGSAITPHLWVLVCLVLVLLP
ncbi:unnamed protein product [Fusarium graminearum]|nr:hypothetical protein HG531_005970 [Fusarium graminearum]CAG1959529.1 unnamed protein product [Fusarium graminearum]CAG2010885.1 unnamed protein product [Fusarium graminearum]